MIDKKLQNLKNLMKGLDQQKLENNHKIDSISLISENLARGKEFSQLKKNKNVNPELNFHKQLSMTQNYPSPNADGSESPCFPSSPVSPQRPHKFTPHSLKLAKHKSLFQPQLHKTPSLIQKQANQINKLRLIKIAKKIYLIKCEEANILNGKKKVELNKNLSQIEKLGLEDFTKTFLMKNSKNGEYFCKKLDLSGMNLTPPMLTLINALISDLQKIDLSRNPILISALPNLSQSPTQLLKILIFKNCALKNNQLCLLFKMLTTTPIKVLNLNSPDLKDRNTLTQYQSLYKFIQTAPCLQTLELENTQLTPQCNIFPSIKQSQSFKSLNISKNTHLIGITKNLQKLNLSFNNLKKPHALRCVDAQLQVLDLTGNPLEIYLFQDFFTITSYPNLKQLTFNKIMINAQLHWLQVFLQKTRNLQKLSMVDCNLSKQSLTNIIFGVQLNRSLKWLDLSSNKFPSQLSNSLSISLSKCPLTHLWLQECDIKDESGSIILQFLGQNTHIAYLCMSKNPMGQKSSEQLCRQLKNGCYNLLVLQCQQNFMKYDMVKQISGYIDRNVYMARMAVLDQYRKYKLLAHNISSSQNSTKQQLQQIQQKLKQIQQQNIELQDLFMKKQKQKQQLQANIWEQQIKMMMEEERKIQQKMHMLQEQLKQLQGEGQGQGEGEGNGGIAGNEHK